MRVSMKLGILHFAEVNLTMPSGDAVRDRMVTHFNANITAVHLMRHSGGCATAEE